MQGYNTATTACLAFRKRKETVVASRVAVPAYRRLHTDQKCLTLSHRMFRYMYRVLNVDEKNN
jgi:hypothetical protein